MPLVQHGVKEQWGFKMGVLASLERLGLDSDALSDALSLEEDEILFINTVSVKGATAEPDLSMVLLTDERGFRRRAEQFAPARLTRAGRRRVGMLYERISGVDIDVEVHLLSTYEELVEALSALDPWGATSLDESFDALGSVEREEAVTLLFGLAGGVPVWNRAAFEELYSVLDQRKLSAWNIRYSLLRSADAIVDAEQSLRRSDPENAYLKLSAAYDALGDAVLFAGGEGMDRWRLRLPKLRALGQSAFLDRYLDVMLVRRGPSEPLREFVARQIDAAQNVAKRLQNEVSAAPTFH